MSLTSWLLRVSRRIWIVLAVLQAAVIFQLSSLSGDSLHPKVFYWKFATNFFHAPLFFLLAFFVGLATVSRDGAVPRLTQMRMLVVVGVTMGYAVVDEWHQSFVPDRSPDPVDLVTDLAGTLAAIMLIRGLWPGGKGLIRQFGWILLPLMLAVGSAYVAAR